MRQCKSIRPRNTLGLKLFSLTHVQYQEVPSILRLSTLVKQTTIVDGRLRSMTCSSAKRSLIGFGVALVKQSSPNAQGVEASKMQLLEA